MLQARWGRKKNTNPDEARQKRKRIGADLPKRTVGWNRKACVRITSEQILPTVSANMRCYVAPKTTFRSLHNIKNRNSKASSSPPTSFPPAPRPPFAPSFNCSPMMASSIHPYLIPSSPLIFRP